jgi:sugar O-acyltransferase (sialic acid O-acetyltransferase NeuD family)
MKRTVAIVGAGGHGRVVADAAMAAGYSEVAFFDDRFPQCSAAGPWSIVGTVADLFERHQSFDEVVVGIGSNRTRLFLHERLLDAGVRLRTIVHPRACLSPHAQLGVGSVVFAGAIINIGAQIGPAAIINTGATVDHDCQLAEGVHLSPGVHLAGTVSIGRLSWLGIGSAVREGINVGANAIIGAGATVISDIGDGVTAIGCPAKPRP